MKYRVNVHLTVALNFEVEAETIKGALEVAEGMRWDSYKSVIATSSIHERRVSAIGEMK